MYVTIRRTATQAAIIGTTALEISCRVTSRPFLILMLIATKRFTPTGGVTCPIARFTVAITPNATTSYPSALHTGSMIGMKMYIAEFASIKHPAIRKMMFTISRKVNWLCAMLPSKLEAASAIPNLVHTKENREALATMSMIPPVVFAESTRMSNISRIETSR